VRGFGGWVGERSLGEQVASLQLDRRRVRNDDLARRKVHAAQVVRRESNLHALLGAVPEMHRARVDVEEQLLGHQTQFESTTPTKNHTWNSFSCWRR